MKKLIAGLAVAFLMVAGLVAGTTSTASAGPYSGTVSTAPVVQAPVVKRGQRPRISLEVESLQGNGRPRGPVIITVSNRRTGETRSFKRFYRGSPTSYTLPRLAPGRYTIVVTYVGYPRSVYRPSSVVRRLFVR